MNTTRNGTPSPHIDAHDWQAQEAALERAANRGDILLAQALRTMPVSQPPTDFASSVARLAASGTRPALREEESTFERRLLVALVATFVLAALVVVAIYGGSWWSMSGEAIGVGATQWMLAGAACLGLSWAFGDARRLLETTRGGRAA